MAIIHQKKIKKKNVLIKNFKNHINNNKNRQTWRKRDIAGDLIAMAAQKDQICDSFIREINLEYIFRKFEQEGSTSLLD